MKAGGERRQRHIPSSEKEWMGKWGKPADPTTVPLELSWMRPWDRMQHPTEDTKPQSIQKGSCLPLPQRNPKLVAEVVIFHKTPPLLGKAEQIFSRKGTSEDGNTGEKQIQTSSQKRKFLWFYFRRILSHLSFPLLALHPPYFTAQAPGLVYNMT